MKKCLNLDDSAGNVYTCGCFAGNIICLQEKTQVMDMDVYRGH